MGRKLLAWGVHFYTALGLVAAAGIALLLATDHPNADAFRYAFLLMALAMLIDATDGTLARWVRVKEVLPGFDGRRLDDLIDFLTYTCLPLLLIWRAQLLPPGQGWWLFVPLLASAYGFCQSSVKTADGYFLGFPSYWNVIAFYLYVLQVPAWLCILLIVFFSVLTFVPSRYLYPTQRGTLNHVTLWMGLAWAVLVFWILSNHQPTSVSAHWLILVSLAFPTYYLVCSWVVSAGLRLQLGKQLHPHVGLGPDNHRLLSEIEPQSRTEIGASDRE
jgi:phosphatidylcholine synthase